MKIPQQARSRNGWRTTRRRSAPTPTPKPIIGYNAIETFAFYADLAGKDLTGQKFLAALESGKEFHDIFGSPPVKFSPTNHLASVVTQVQQIQNGRWKVVREGLMF